jgi:hypothetical protein
MPLDALPVNRAVHVTAGSLAVVDLYLRDQVNAALLQAEILAWDFMVYEDQGASPETLIYSEIAKSPTATNADTSVVCLTAVAQTGAGRVPIGHTFLHKFDPVVLFSAAAGRNFTIEYKFTLDNDAGPMIVRVALVIDPAYQ